MEVTRGAPTDVALDEVHAQVHLGREEDEHDGADDDEFARKAGLARSASLRFRAFCAIPAGKPKRMLSKLWPLARGVTTERH